MLSIDRFICARLVRLWMLISNIERGSHFVCIDGWWGEDRMKVFLTYNVYAPCAML